MLPKEIKNELITFLLELPIEKFTKEWEATQLAISILNSPDSFKKGIHVYLTSRDSAHEEGCYDNKELFIKIYPHKLMMKRTHSEYNSYAGIDRDEVRRYVYPSDKYDSHHFFEVMTDLGDLFSSCYSMDNSDASGVCYANANFTIETNMKMTD